MKDIHCYDDIIKFEYRGPVRHVRMKRSARAAQFAPFAALTGYDAAIRENARLTQERIVPAEAELAALDRRFRLLAEHLDERPEIRLTRFRPDERKSGGTYETITGVVKQIDPVARRIRLWDGTDIPMDDVLAMDGALFDILELEKL